MAPIHHTTARRSRPNQNQPWYAHLTLDLLLHVLANTLFQPFLAALIPLCLRAVAIPYNSPSFILTCALAICVSLYSILEPLNRRIAYGAPRNIKWEDEVVVITGGLGGLGGCTAEILALKGVTVAVLDNRVEWGKAKGDPKGVLDGEEKEGVKYYHCDVRISDEIESKWRTIVEELGMPTVLINNAAIIGGRPLLSSGMGAIKRIFRTNAVAHFHLSQLFIYGLMNMNPPRGGTIVTVSSVLAYLGASNLSAYTASKAALIAYHNSLSAELASTAPQIKTILVTPGQLDTQLFGNVKLRGWMRNFFGPVVGAGEVAVRIVEMIDKGEGGVISLPAYARWIAWLGVLPVGLQKIVREWSGIDSAFAASNEPDEGSPGD